MSGPAEKRHALLITLNFACVYLVWGSTYLAIRIAIRDVPPALMAGTRFTLAGALLLGALRWRGVPLPRRDLVGPIALTGLLLLFGGNFLVSWSEQYVASGMAAVIVANLPFFMVVLEAMRRGGERLNLMGALGLLVGFTGMWILMGERIATAGAGTGVAGFKGEIALLGANLCWALGSIYSKHRIKGVAPLMAAALEMLFAGLGLLVLGLVLGEASEARFTPHALLSVAWLVVGGSLLGYSSYIWLLSHVPAAKVSTYAYVNPVIAVGLGALILGEPLSLRMAAGTAVILGGVAVVNAAKIKFRA